MFFGLALAALAVGGCQDQGDVALACLSATPPPEPEDGPDPCYQVREMIREREAAAKLAEVSVRLVREVNASARMLEAAVDRLARGCDLNRGQVRCPENQNEVQP